MTQALITKWGNSHAFSSALLRHLLAVTVMIFQINEE